MQLFLSLAPLTGDSSMTVTIIVAGVALVALLVFLFVKPKKKQ